MSLRILFVASLLIAASVSTIVAAVWAQDVPDLRRTLGHPVSETYRPEKDITVTVSYGVEGQICELRLNGPVLKIQQLADKLIPVKARGRMLGARPLIPAMNCCDSFSFNYENVIMSYYFNDNQSKYRFIYKGGKCVVPSDITP